MTDLSNSAVITPVKQAKKSSNMNTPLPSKGWYPNVESGSKQSTTVSMWKKSVSMKATAPAFVTPMKMPLPNSRDIAILHESRIFKSLLEKAAQKKQQQHQSPKRDPILQEGDDYVQDFRPCCKRLPASEKYSECIDENFRRTKKVGDFNYIYNPPQEPKPQGIKSFVVFPSPCLDEVYRRIARPGRNQSQAPRNPLTEGDEQSAIFRRSKRPGVVNDHQERLNNRKHVLPADRGRSCRGRVFRDMTFTLGENDYSLLGGSHTDRSYSQQRPLTAQEKKMRGTMKGILEYEDGPNYRPEIVTDKCNKMRFSDVVGSQEAINERIFGRKRTLEY